MMWLRYVRVACVIAICAWVLSAMFLVMLRGRLDSGNVALRVAQWIFHEVKPFYRVMAVAKFGIECLTPDEWLWIPAALMGLDFWNYHIYKDIDDDDRWDRRKREVLEKISIVDGKLAVIPA